MTSIQVRTCSTQDTPHCKLPPRTLQSYRIAESRASNRQSSVPILVRYPSLVPILVRHCCSRPQYIHTDISDISLLDISSHSRILPTRPNFLFVESSERKGSSFHSVVKTQKQSSFSVILHLIIYQPPTRRIV